MWLWNQVDLCSNPDQPLISCVTLGNVLPFSGLHISKVARVNTLPGAVVRVSRESISSASSTGPSTYWELSQQGSVVNRSFKTEL